MDIIEGRTEHGTGLVLPLAKGVSHLMLVYNAAHREWPMTVAEAAAEISEATEHFGEMQWPEGLMTDDTAHMLGDWRRRVIEVSTQLRSAVRENAEQTIVEFGDETIRQLAREAWTVLTLTDREITGLSDGDTDPGRTP